jgi:hypothetical protein
MYRNPAGSADRGFLLSNGLYSTLSDPIDPNNTWANGVNNAGSIDQLGFVFSDGTYFTLSGPAYGINDAGEVVGYLSGGGVPEPSTWAMLLIGFAGLGFACHRRTKLLGAKPRSPNWCAAWSSSRPGSP